MVGEQFGQSASEEICGMVVSTKANEDCISVWNRTASNKDATIRIRDVLKETLDIPVNAAFEYKAHHISIDHLSSLARTGAAGAMPTLGGNQGTIRCFTRPCPVFPESSYLLYVLKGSLIFSRTTIVTTLLYGVSDLLCIASWWHDVTRRGGCGGRSGRCRGPCGPGPCGDAQFRQS